MDFDHGVDYVWVNYHDWNNFVWRDILPLNMPPDKRASILGYYQSLVGQNNVIVNLQPVIVVLSAQ
jgi:hypothetical protein